MRSDLRSRHRDQRRILAALTHGRPVVVRGPSGVGKTTLLAAVAARCAEQGARVVRVTATADAAGIPFGSFAGLLPDEVGSGDATTLLHGLRAELRARAGRDGLLLVVDDAHDLDEASAALVHQVATGDDRVAVLAAVRTTADAPEAIVRLWRDEPRESVELTPLDDTEAAELVGGLLDGPVTDAAVRDLQQLACGNARYLRELVLAARDHGTLAERDGRWTLDGPLQVPARLVDLVASRIRRLDGEARRALALVALGAPLTLATLGTMVDTGVLRRLEDAGWLKAEGEGAACRVVPAHPVDAEVAAAELGLLRRHELLAELVTAVTATGDPDGADRVRLAAWRLELGEGVAADELLAAGREALRADDHDLAETLAAAAVARGEDPESRLLLGQALSSSERAADAEEVLAAAWESATAPTLRARIALARAPNLAFRLEDAPAATRVLDEAADLPVGADLRDQIDVLRAHVADVLGDLSTTIAVADRVRTRADASPQALVTALTFSSVARTMRAELAAARRDLDDAERVIAATPSLTATTPGVLGVNRVLVDLAAGDLRDGEEAARRGYRQALRAGDDDRASIWASTFIEALSLRGRVQEAERVAGDAVALLRRRDPFGLLPILLAGHARTLAQLGRTQPARRLLAELDRSARHDSRAEYPRAGARTWIHAAEGDLAKGAAIAEEGGRRALTGSLVVWGASRLHDAVRLGEAARVADLLAELAQAAEGRLLPALAGHARALADRDAEGLLASSEDLELLGADLLAAEAAAQAAHLLSADGSRRRALRSTRRAAVLASGCPGVVSPALAAADAPDPLTRRERQIALLAAGGRTSAEIAESLVISHRTVDNHLSSAYRKLGISGRDELAAVLGREPD